MKDIVIIEHDPLSNRIKEGFCIDFIKEKGGRVTYLDLSNFYYPDLVVDYQINESYVKKLNNIDEILKYLEGLDIQNTIFISEAHFNWKSRKIYKFLNKVNAKVIRIVIYPNASLIKYNLFQKIRILGIYRIAEAIFLKIYQHFNSITIWNKILTPVKSTKNIIRINHPDYEVYKGSLKRISRSEDFIVFLDEAFPVHPEIKFCYKKDYSSLVSPYRKSLIMLFDYLERTFDKKIIVCAHPKSEYKGDEFGHHKIVYGETCDMVRKSAFVLMHVSTSSVYAILDDKPIIMLSSKEYRHNVKYTLEFQKEYAKLLGLDIFDISDWRPIKGSILPLDRRYRENFIFSYLTSMDTEALSNNDIICNYLKMQ